MIDREIGIVHSIIYEEDDLQELIVLIENKKYKAMNLIPLSGRCKQGDRILLNTTAIRLQLGTGGYHYVIANLDACDEIHDKIGHIMKMRYTPLQSVCQTMEEQGSPYHKNIKEFQTLDGMPVIIGSLHSMLAPAAAIMKYYKPDVKITYIMSDGASLPIAISKAVRELKRKSIIDSTITFGHAFGGDHEAVNIYTALIGAKEVTQCDIAIVAMGPGIVGTGTKYGFTGLEQGSIIDAVNTLGGKAISIPRLSFADQRKRHYGLSHHAITTFTKIAKTPSIVTFPSIQDLEKMKIIQDQVTKNKLMETHNIEYRKIEDLEKALINFDIKVSTMGRNYYQDTEFFQSAAAAGIVALEQLDRKEELDEV